MCSANSADTAGVVVATNHFSLVVAVVLRAVPNACIVLRCRFGVVAVGNVAIITANGTNVLVTIDVRVNNAKVLDIAATDIAKQTNILSTGVVDIQAADGVVVAIECAGEVTARRTHWCPSKFRCAVERAILGQNAVVNHNVGNQNAFG